MKKTRENQNEEFVLNVLLNNQTHPGENVGIKSLDPGPIPPPAQCQTGDRTSSRATTICVIDLFP